MSELVKWEFSTRGEGLVDITAEIQRNCLSLLKLQNQLNFSAKSLQLFCPHTSCALTITEAFEASARQDVERFLQHLAPRNLHFITHLTEGADDSPSHMKSLLLQYSLLIPVNQQGLILGQWQGIFLAEFRDGPKLRQLWVQLL